MAGLPPRPPPSLQQSAPRLPGRMLAPGRAGPEHQLRAGPRGAAVGGRRGTEAPGPPRGAQPSRAARAGKCAEPGEALCSPPSAQPREDAEQAKISRPRGETGKII